MKQLQLQALTDGRYKYAVIDPDSSSLLGHITEYRQPSQLVQYSFVPLAGEAIAISTSMRLVLEMYVGEDVRMIFEDGKSD